MVRTHFDFTKLLSPLTPSEFFDKYWEKRPLTIFRQDPDYYSGILSMRDIDYILTSTDLRLPSFRMIKNGSTIAPHEYTRTGNIGGSFFSGAADVDRIFNEYHQTATIILQGLQRYWKPLSLLCRSIEKQLSHPVQTNIYLTPKAAQGFDAHYDTHDVFILQLEGKKHWRIYDSPMLLPHRSQPYDDFSSSIQIGDPINEFDLNVGDLLYIPRGYIHEALTSENYSLHITMGVISYTWIDVFTEALSVCKENTKFRVSLPIGFANHNGVSNSMEEQLLELLKVFSNDVGTRATEIIERVTERFISSRHSIQDGRLMEMNDIDNVDLNSIVSVREDIIFRVIPAGENVNLLFHGKKISFPEYVKTPLRFITEEGIFSVGSIPGELDDPGKLVMIRRLIREGFLTTAGEK